MSKLIRRVHLYLALFLSPWLAVYALSTIVMNHRTPRQSPPAWQPEREVTLRNGPPASATNTEMARQILSELGMDGAFQVNQRRADGVLIVTRQYTFNNRRVTYTIADQKAVVERQNFRLSFWLEKMHRRRGFQHDSWVDDLWAASVDLVIIAMVLWILTGLWMWWELKKTRLLGAGFVLGGIVLFAAFLMKG